MIVVPFLVLKFLVLLRLALKPGLQLLIVCFRFVNPKLQYILCMSYKTGKRGIGYISWGKTVHEVNIGGHTSLSMFTTVLAEGQFETRVTKSFSHKPE